MQKREENEKACGEAHKVSTDFWGRKSLCCKGEKVRRIKRREERERGTEKNRERGKV